MQAFPYIPKDACISSIMFHLQSADGKACFKLHSSSMAALQPVKKGTFCDYVRACVFISDICALVQVTDRMLSHPDARTVLRAVLKAWLPLSEAVLSMSVEHLPDPASAAPGRLARLLPPQQLHLKGVQLSKDLQQVRTHPHPSLGAVQVVTQLDQQQPAEWQQ